MRYLGRSAVGVGLLVGCPGAPPQETGTGSTDTSTTTTTPPPPPTLAIAAPVSGAALEEKFLSCAGVVLSAAASRRALELTRKVAELPDVSVICTALRR
jgi:hypothetical protein